ncbi:aminodeoxychorismate synthase component I [Marinobacter sp.]|uniref:aminodeoxychorismate synthase component I n=1 Tax=Marinobacter sp. TaxID=50741 RepID=UPI0035C760D1
MTDVAAQPIDRDLFTRLQAHACQHDDFVYLGSTGTSGDTGEWSFFSALSTSSYELRDRDRAPQSVQNAVTELDELRQRYHFQGENAEIPAGGIVGFVSYELGYLKEKKLRALSGPLPTPVLQARLFLWMASYNRKTGEYFLRFHDQCPDAVRAKVEHWRDTPAAKVAPPWTMTAPFQATQPQSAFEASVQTVKDYIEAGDCYQANLSQEFSGRYQGDPWHAFEALTGTHPTPYSAFIRGSDFSILSISPERFLEIDGGVVKTSPIKGTRPRGRTEAEDQSFALELQDSEKDRAENLMIVDLLRNDLSVNAKPQSVRVDRLFALESYQNVHHLVSHIRAELREGVSPLKAFIDAFPGGSITGAPKLRAMEIIKELEPHARGPYCGSVFFYGLGGRLDSSIAIRTLVCTGDGVIRCCGGGGIVADSDPQAEYQETLTKVAPLMRFLQDLTI